MLHSRRYAIDSLIATITSDARDWSNNERDAWIYGIVVGWDDALPEIVKKFGWDNIDVIRLKKFHEEIKSYVKK